VPSGVFTPVPAELEEAFPPSAAEDVAVAGAFGSLRFVGSPPVAPGDEKLNTVPACSDALLVTVVALLREIGTSYVLVLSSEIGCGNWS
jgi:hypothetical protein